MTRCLVIGGAGFLGGAIVDELLRRGNDVRIADRTGHSRLGVAGVHCDVTRYSSVREAVAVADEVYHIAGVLGTAELNETVQEAIDINVAGATNVFRACIDARVPRVFYPGKPNCWCNVYTITKDAAEQFAELFNAASPHTSIVRVRWFNAYGPGQHIRPVRKIVPTFALCARFGLPLPIWGSGENTVDMVHAADIARWSVEATRQGLSDRVYELGTGQPRRVLDVAADVNRLSGNLAGLAWQPMRAGETENTRIVADIAPLRSALASRGVVLEFADWEDTLAETLAYYNDLPEDEARAALHFHRLSGV